jgi:hypothetical protein
MWLRHLREDLVVTLATVEAADHATNALHLLAATATLQHQDLLQVKQEKARKEPRPGATEQQTALLSLQELALGLTDLCGELWMKMQLSSFLAAARSLALHHTHHSFKGLSQPPQLLYLPSAAAAAGAPGGSSSDGGAAAAAGSSGLGGVSPIKSASQHTMYLTMPNLQLPPYMLLLAGGAWCGNAPAGSGSYRPPAAAAVSLPSCAAALGPTLCMSFPRRRVVGESRDCLLLVLCDAQGLAGPVLKRIRVPVSCYSSVGALAAAAAAAGVEAAAAAAAAAAGLQRKRKRDDDAAAAGSVGTPQDEQQQQQQAQRQLQQQQRQLRVRGMLLQPDEHAAELGAAVRWCQSRLTFERVKLELAALQLEVEEVQLLRLPTDQLPGSVPSSAAAAANPQQQQRQQVWQQPGIRLLGMPGVELFQQLQRKPGCAPSSLGLQEVWFSTGPEYGQWRMHVRGSFYHQAPAAAAGVADLAAAAAPAASGRSAQQQQQGPADVYEYDLRAGDSVRCAVLQLLRIVHMQHFLNRLETLAWGAQSLQVVQVGSSSSSMGPGVAALQGSVVATPAAAAADGDVDVAMAEADGSGGSASPAKRLKQQQQQDDVSNGSAAAAAGSGMANGILPHSDGTSGSGQKPSSNGQLADGEEQQHRRHTHSAAAAAGAPAGSSSCSSPYGLLFHWEGTGLVRLAQYSCCTAQLECGAPLQPRAGGSSSSSSESSRQRLQFAVQWQPRFEFTTHDSYSTSSSTAAGLSSSTTTTWVDVRPSAVASTFGSPSAAAAGSTRAHSKAASAQDVLGVTCSMQCNAPHVPADLLNELCDMVNSGCIDLLLDGFSLVAWPLSGIAAALAAPEQPAAQLALAAPGLQAAQLAGKLSVASCRTVSSCAVSGPYHVRYKVDWLQQQQQGALVPVSSAAGTQPPAAAAAAAGLVLELQFACHGRVKVLIGQQDPAAATQQQQVSSSSSASGQATAAGIRGFVRHFMQQKGARVPLLPAVSTGHYLTVLPEQGSKSVDAVAGFWLQAQHLGVALQELLQYWQQHIVDKQTQQQQGAVAAAVKAEALAPPLQQQQQQVQGQQQQQQQQPVPVQQAGQGAVAGQAAGGMPQQQQQPGQVSVKPEQQQQQQQQPMMQNNHMPHVVQQPMQHAAAGHVVSGR